MRCYPLIGGAAALTLLGGCGGGSSGSSSSLAPAQGPPAFTSVSQVRVSQMSSFTPGCDGVPSTGTLYTDTAAEPYLAVNPLSPANLIAAWQQNRWSDGGAQGLNLAASFDGGMSWTLTNATFSRCTGGSASNAGNYARATDVWLAVSPNGVAYALSLSYTGASLTPDSSSAMLVAQSRDGGMSWSLPIAVIQDGSEVFNDKGSITADPINSSFVYVVWDRLITATAGPSYFAMTADGGSSWQLARSIYDPGPTNQTIGNQIVVLPGDVIVNIFTEIDTAPSGSTSATVRAMRSTDHGTSWSTPVTVTALQAVGTTNPANGAAVRDGSTLLSASVGPGGILYLAWQDSRFAHGEHDGIAMTQSTDGGLSWSTPVQVNADHSVQAFTPTIHVRADGVIAVTYFDLRNNTAPSAGTLWTDCWMATSADGVTFRETHLSGSFNLELAPDSQGLFLGDYESLVSANGAFLPFYAQVDRGSQVRTDAFISFPSAAAAAETGAGAAVRSFVAVAAPPRAQLTPAAERRVMERLRLVQAQRLRGR